MNLNEIFEMMINSSATDIFIRVGSCLKGRVNTEIKVIDEYRFSSVDIIKIVGEMIGEQNQRDLLQENKSSEFSLWYKDEWRFRVGIFYQRNTVSIVVRKIDLKIPVFSDLNLPVKPLEDFCHQRRGLILVTGITGSGKSTAIATMLEYINRKFGRHILTVEEPIEFVFTDKQAIISQREIGKDVANYEDALRQFAVHSPDIMYIGNIRDYATCHAALTAAETGVLVFSTLHTVNAASTIERIINFFPPYQHHFVLMQLSTLFKGAISLRLLPHISGNGLVPAYEVLTLSPSIARLLRENKVWEIPKYMENGDIYGMNTFNQCLINLVESKQVSPQIALDFSDKVEELELNLRNKGLL
ncbi:MAG: PilT/PilU family type 4a pilus ATPase, partial [Candidatus Omnitrophota bacterium]